MTENMLARLFEHNNWANSCLIEACSALDDEQLDAKPRVALDSGSIWRIRLALLHLVEAQQGYLSLLTLPPEARREARLSFGELPEVARTSGEGLLALARDQDGADMKTRLRTLDGYCVEPWVVMLQSINHATDHRRQISGLLRDLGVTRPRLDGWSFGEITGTLVPVST